MTVTIISKTQNSS